MALAPLARALRFDIPKRLADKAGRVYFDAVTQLYGALQGVTPVDTGFLRASLAATLQGAAPPPMPQKGAVRARAVRGKGVVVSSVNFKTESKPVSAFISPTELRALPSISIGYRADYAIHVEDKQHMIKSVRARWPHFLTSAVRNAE